MKNLIIRREHSNVPFHKYCSYCKESCTRLEQELKDYVLITNVWNEESKVADAFRNVSQQDKKPQLWIWFEDGSTDNTYTRIQEEAKRYPDIKIRIERMPIKSRANFFSLGKTHETILKRIKQTINRLGVDYYGILDVDSYPCPGYFARLIKILDSDGRLGAVSGYPIGEWSKRRVAQPMNSGKLIRWQIVQNIEKYWDFCPDTFYNIKAISQGYKVAVFCIPLYQNRPSSNFLESGAQRMGRVAYYGGRPFIGVFLRALRRCILRQHGTSMLRGYFMEWIRGTWHCEDEDVRAFFEADKNFLKVFLSLSKFFFNKIL